MNTKVVNVVKCFDCNHPLWTNDKEYNMLVVKMILNNCYKKFRRRHFLFLNDVYQELGMSLTRQGQIAGWVFDKDHAKDYMWTVWTKDDGYDNDVYITFEPLSDILDALPNE